jgi:hypothetical protein
LTQHWLQDIALSPLNMARTRTKVALIGNSQIDRSERPPFEDHAWDIWSCNSLWKLCRDTDKRFRADQWFELHPLSVQTEQERIDMDDCPVPLFVLEEPLKPHWQTFPLEKLRQRFGARDFYTCTMAYQLAYALMEGYKTVGLWGMELWQGSSRERTVELRCLEYWLGVAKGMGVEVVLPDYSCLIQHPHLYGYEYHVEAEYAKGEVAGIVKEYGHEFQQTLTPDRRLKFARLVNEVDLD